MDHWISCHCLLLTSVNTDFSCPVGKDKEDKGNNDQQEEDQFNFHVDPHSIDVHELINSYGHVCISVNWRCPVAT